MKTGPKSLLKRVVKVTDRNLTVGDIDNISMSFLYDTQTRFWTIELKSRNESVYSGGYVSEPCR